MRKFRNSDFGIRIDGGPKSAIPNPKSQIVKVLVGLALAFFAAEQAEAGGLPSRKENWRKVQTAHFTLFGNASESTIREAGLNLERLRSVLSLLTSSAHVNAPVPTAVYVFKSDSAMKPYKPLYEGKPGNLAGYFLAGLDGNYIALATAWNEDPRPIVHHEYLHFFARNNFKPMPVWLEEGLAEFYSTFQASSKEARTGRPIEHHVYLLRQSGLMPLAKLFAVDQDSPDYHEWSRQGPFYAQSWALLHLLISGKPERKESFKRFLGLLQRGKSSDEAFRESFGVSGPEFLPELAGYIRRGRFGYSVLSLRELTVPTETKTEPMTSTEVLCRLGDLLAHGPEDRLGPAEAHYAAALAEEPSHAGGLSGMGYVRYRQERYDEAGEFFRRAAASPGADFRAHYYSGWLLMHGLSREPLNISSLNQKQRETLSQARMAFRESLARNGDFAEARAELGRTYLFESSKDRAAEGILWLEAALRLMPSREDVVLSLAELYERSGNATKSDELRARFLGPEAASKLARQREAGSSFQRSLDRVNELLEKRQEAEAIALFESLLAQAPEDVRQAFQDELTALRRGAASNRLIKEYNEGVALANKQDYEGALIRFRKVAAETDDFALAQAANDKIRDVNRWLSNRRTRKPGVKKKNSKALGTLSRQSEIRLLPSPSRKDCVDRLHAPLEHAPQARHLAVGGCETDTVSLELEAQHRVAVFGQEPQDARAVGAHPLGRRLRVETAAKVGSPVRSGSVRERGLVGEIDPMCGRSFARAASDGLAVLRAPRDYCLLMSSPVGGNSVTVQIGRDQTEIAPARAVPTSFHQAPRANRREKLERH